LAGNNYNAEFFENNTENCRRVVEAFQAEAPAGFRPFPLPGDKPRYAPDRQYALKHLFIDVALDFPSKSVSGRVLSTLNPVNDGLSQIVFDAADLEVASVRQGEASLDFRREVAIVVTDRDAVAGAIELFKTVRDAAAATGEVLC